MTTFTNEPNGLSATGIEFFQAGSRKGALSMEISGLRRRGQSAYSICKQVYGFVGSKHAVLAQMDRLVEGLIAEKQGTISAEDLVFVQKAMWHSRPAHTADHSLQVPR
jgi:hypothetical protein